MQYSGNDKYHICHHLFKIQIKCKWKVDGVLDPFKSLLPPIFRKYKLKLRKLFVLNDDGDFVPRFQQIRRLWSQSAATSGQRLSDCVGSFITLCHHHWLTSIEPILIFVSTVHQASPPESCVSEPPVVRSKREIRRAKREQGMTIMVAELEKRQRLIYIFPDILSFA